MCEFCREWENKETICGSEIHISYCENRNPALTDAQVLKSSADDKPEIVIFHTECQWDILVSNFAPCVAGS